MKTLNIIQTFNPQLRELRINKLSFELAAGLINSQELCMNLSVLQNQGEVKAFSVSCAPGGNLTAQIEFTTPPAQSSTQGIEQAELE